MRQRPPSSRAVRMNADAVRVGNVEYVRDSECVHRRQVAGTTLVTQEQVWQNFNGQLDAAPMRLVKDIAHSHEPGHVAVGESVAEYALGDEKDDGASDEPGERMIHDTIHGATLRS